MDAIALQTLREEMRDDSLVAREAFEKATARKVAREQAIDLGGVES